MMRNQKVCASAAFSKMLCWMFWAVTCNLHLAACDESFKTPVAYGVSGPRLAKLFGDAGGKTVLQMASCDFALRTSAD